MITKSGRPSIPLWIDGERVESTRIGRDLLKATSQKKYKEFLEAIKTGTPYHGHQVSRRPPKTHHEKEGCNLDPQMRRAPALLRGHCTQRLGTYRDQRW
jgi:hypothetical protein